MEIISLLWGTVILRPYVFVFLAFYLTIAILNMGVVRSLCFTVLAYLVAFLSEYSSTRNGFPFGHYSYIEATRDQELWISNVPFMDSLSFAFLIYVSYTLSLLLWAPLIKREWDIRLGDIQPLKHSVRVIASAAILCMLLDVIIDPAAFLGDRWFLGKIYFYQEEGEYFHIPLTNFAGWIFVAGVTLLCFALLDCWLDKKIPFHPQYQLPAQALLGPGIYFGVLIFNLAVTFYIGEMLLGFLGTLISLAIFSLALFRVKRATSRVAARRRGNGKYF
ncbi:MAG: carotenoid biosynthesis protein [Nitrospinae bacterium]|nr:carotenoid biosynthesis protein [Nitrospinota bacterium]